MVAQLGDRPQLHIIFGRAYRETDFLSEAIEEFKKAVALDPGFPRAHYYLGLTFLLKDGAARISDAVEEFKIELTEHPNEFLANYYLGIAYTIERKWELATSFLQKASLIEPQNPDPYFHLGQAYQATEKHELAIVALEKTIALQPDHISAYCLTYEEDTEFFLRYACGEFRQDTDMDAEFFEVAMSILEDAGYEHYEISNYARPGFSSVHNSAYWLGKDYLGIGPSAVSTVGMRRWQNVCDYRTYIDRVLSSESPCASRENLTHEMKRMERIALTLRTRDGVRASDLKRFARSQRMFGTSWSTR